MVKKGYRARRKKSSSKNKEELRRCFKCGNKDHLVAQCPYNSDNDDNKKSKKKDKKEKKEKKDRMTIKKKKGGSYVVTWDSDASSSDDDDSDDDKTSKKKGHASVAIQEKSSLFDTPSCFMAKATKVKTCDDGCDHEEHDSESESDDGEPAKYELIDMLEDAKEHFNIKKREYKDLRKELKALKQAFDELNASHERLEEAHEKLGKAHKKLEKAHSSQLNEQNEKKHVVTYDKSLTCDVIDESFYKTIIVASTNPSCSTSTSTSSSSDGFTSDASLMVENETLKKEVKELNHTLAKAYGGKDRLLMRLGSQRASLYKEGLGYIPRKARPPLLITKLVL
jgi:hypothetical protein